MADGDALIEAPGERELLASIDAAVVAADADGRVTVWNHAAESIFGRRAADVLGRPLGELAADGSLGDGVLTAFEVAAAGSGYAGELQVRRPDGTLRTVASTVSPVRGPDGGVAGAIAVLNDVSELRRGEDAIRRRHELYRLVLENVDDLIVLATPDGRLLYASPSHLRRLGWSSEELVGVNALTRVHRDDAARLERRLGEVLDSGTAMLEPVRVQRRDGEWVQLEARLVALRDDQAEETLVLSVARDVSQTQEAEASARESRELLEAVLGAVPDAIVVLSRDGEFFYVNRPALDLLGYEDAATMLRAGSAEVLSGFELLDEDGGPLPAGRLPTRRVFAGADEAEELVRYRVRATGEERYSVVRALPVRVEGGEPELAITLFHDVTEERRGSRRLQFLAETSAALSATLDVESALRGLEALVVPDFAAGYSVELADGGSVEAGTRTDDATTLPLVSRRRRLGTLTLFGVRDAELAEELAHRVATAVDNARLHRETGRAAALLDTLFATAPVGLAFLDREHRFVRVNRALAEINGLSEAEHVGRRLHDLIPALEPAIEERFRRVLETGEPLLDQEETGATSARPGEERHFRVSYYPIRSADDELLGIGVAVIETTEQKRVESERAELLAREQAAREEAEAAAQTLRRLASVTEAALEHLGLEDLLYAVLNRLVEVLGGDTAVMLLLNDEDALEVKAAIGLGSAIELAVPIQLGRGMAGRVAESGEPRLVDDLDEIELASPHLRARGVRSLVAVPIASREGIVGVVHIDSLHTAAFGERDVRLLELATDRIALAIKQSQLYEAESRARSSAQEAEERLGFLAEASAVLGSSLDYEHTLSSLAELVVPRFADLCAIHVVRDDGSIEIVSIVHRDQERSAQAFESAREHPIDPDATTGIPAVIRQDRAQLLLEVTAEDVAEMAAERPGREESLRALVGASALAAPLTARGRTYGAITFVCDVSGRRYSEDDLAFAEELAGRLATAVDNARLYREAEDQARAARILQSVGDGVFLVDDDGVVRYWNRAAETITGLPAERVVDRRVGDAVPGWAAIEGLVPLGAAPELVPLQLPGRELWLSVSGVALDEGTVYAFRDLTEERAIEELRTEFVSTVSHELRTPLAAIYGAAMTLRREDVQLDETQRANLLDVVAGESDRLARTVNDILWASRLDSGMLTVAIGSCDPVQLATTVVASQRAHLPEGVEVALEAEEGLPQVAADPDKVRQVLVNLLDNAVKYSPDGGRVTLRIHERGAQVRFVVSDQGLGIPYAEQRRIFDKFYRLDPDLTRGVGGTGLGLYICHALVRRMHGRIWVESEPGRGSTFTVELPVAGGEADVTAHVAPKPGGP